MLITLVKAAGPYSNDVAQLWKSLDSVIDEIDSSQKSIIFEVMLDNHKYLVYAVIAIVVYFLIHFVINKINLSFGSQKCALKYNNERIKRRSRCIHFGDTS